jgi:peroxiredoxin
MSENLVPSNHENVAPVIEKSAAQVHLDHIDSGLQDSLRLQDSQMKSALWKTGLISGGLVILIIVAAIFVIRPALQRNEDGTSTSIGTLSPEVTPLPVNAVAPKIPVLKDINNTDFDASQYLGKQPVFLYLFATWCPNCYNYTSTVNQVYNTYQSKGLKVISVVASPYGHNYETSGGTNKSSISMEDLRWFADTFQVKFTVLYDPLMQVVNTYGLVSGGYPTTYLIDTTGKIAYASAGTRVYDELKAEIDKIIKG